MIRTLLFAALVLLLGCGKTESPSESIDPGYSMQVQCMHVPEDKTYPCKLTSCMEMDSCTGLFKVTFTQNFLDSIDIRFFNWMCDSLPWLNFEYEETYNSEGKVLESAIMCGAKADKNLLMKNDSLTFYIDMHDPHPKAAYAILGNDFWIDSSGYLVPYQLYFYRPISKGYGFRRHNRRWSDMVRVYRRPDLEKRIEDRHLLEKARFELYKQNIGNGCEQRFIFDDTTGLNGAVSAWELEYALDTFVRHSDTIDFVFKPAFPFKGYLCRVFQLNNGPMELDSWCSVSILKNSPIPNTLYDSDEKAKQITMFDYLAEEQRFLICYSEYQGKIHPWLQWYMKTCYFL